MTNFFHNIRNLVFERWAFMRYLYIIIFGIIAFVSLYFTNKLVKALEKEEREKVEIWAGAVEQLITADTEKDDVSFLVDILSKNESIPIIMLGKDNQLYDCRNITLPEQNKEAFIAKKVEDFKLRNTPIKIHLSDGETQTIYYDNSIYVNMLEYYPIAQLLIIIVYLITAYCAFRYIFVGTQDKIWVGLSKETAHQLGTPISSLMAWTEILQDTYPNNDFVVEMKKDINRLEIIASRFSKIGSEPTVDPVDLISTIESSVDYMRKRISKRIPITIYTELKSAQTRLNVPLFAWVIENLCKNAVDSIGGAEGKIDITLDEKDEKNYRILISDTGKGIPKSKFKTVFHPGYTTKKRGWGLGLSLAKRIIETYHKGKIFVSSSELNKGTTFCIFLPKL